MSTVRVARVSSRKRRIAIGLAGLLAAVSGLWACDSNQPHAGANQEGSSTTVLVGELILDDPIVGLPKNLRVSGSRLWMVDAVRDPSLHVFDLSEGVLLSSFGRSGEAPGEFQSTPQIHTIPGDSSGAVWAWDYGLSRLTRLAPDGPDTDPQTVRVESPAGTDRAWRMIWIADDRVIGIHPSRAHRFSVVHPETGEVRSSTPGSFLGSDEVPEDLRRQATMTGFGACGWPGRGFTMIYFWTGRIELYDLDGRFIRLAEVPTETDAFERTEDGDFIHHMERVHYQSCEVYEDRLYALYSGRLYAAFEGDEADLSEYVHVFDWSGSHEDVLRLEPAVSAIAIDPDGRMFGGSWGDARVYRFDLSEIP